MSPLLRKPHLWSHFEHHWQAVVSQIMFNRSADEYRDEPDAKSLEQLRHYYYGHENVDAESLDRLSTMIGDSFAFGGTTKSWKMWELKSKVTLNLSPCVCKGNEFFSYYVKKASAQPVYKYSFNYEGYWKTADIVNIQGSNILPKFLLGRLGMKVGSCSETRTRFSL